jgi:hypothetical protein
MGAALGLVAALMIAACGGSSGGAADNGVAAKSADQIVTQATQAIDAVHTARVSGDVGSAHGQGAIHLDLHLVDGTGATGSMSEGGLAFKLISVNNSAYVNGSPAFWKQFGGSAAVQLLQGRWLRAPAATGPFASFASLTDLHKLVAGLLTGHGALTKGSTSTIDGQKVVALTDKTNQGTLYVATTGKPYPIRIANGGSGGGGQLDFSDFNQPVTVKAPASSIDITKLHKH